MAYKKQSGGLIPRKELQKKLRGILMQAIGSMGIKVPSKKLKKEVKQACRDIAERLILDLARNVKTKQTKPEGVISIIGDNRK